ncbi:MAG: uncharacterized protein KVP18_003164 [Porospora cf. gigantea A]|uniref:uncharacterized protein n=1 Tax=Porospora cf. gigantea A TaxID=2853593 RepID=UPI003559F680|nr:MAG: hypothetical protein KVP18_003164 [Porospora cf. gigantea A]
MGDEWEDDFEFEYDFEEEETLTPDDPQQAAYIRVESLMCDAEDLRREDPHAALNIFKEVALSSSEGVNDKTFRLLFQAALETCLLAARLHLISELTCMVKVLLDRLQSLGFSVVASTMQQVTSEAIESFSALDRTDMNLLIQCFEECLARVSEIQNARSIILVKLLELYLEVGCEVKFNSTIKELFDYIDTVDPEEAGFSFDSLVLEVCTLNLRFAEKSGQVARMRSTLNRIKKLKWTLNDPRTQAVVHASTATIHVSLGNYEGALAEHFRAIQCYQAAGLHALAVSTFKKLVVMSILGQSKLSPFESTESKAYAGQLEDAKTLRRHFDEGSIAELCHFLSTPGCVFAQEKDAIIQVKRRQFVAQFFKTRSHSTVEEMRSLLSLKDDSRLVQLMLCVPTSTEDDENALLHEGDSPAILVDLRSGQIVRSVPSCQWSTFQKNDQADDLRFYREKMLLQQQELLGSLETNTV